MNLFLALLTTIVSIAAFAVAFKTYQNDQCTLSVDAFDKAIPIKGVILDDGSMLTNEYGMFTLNVWIVNPSNHDISIFDVRIVTDSGKEIQYLTSRQLGNFNGEPQQNNGSKRSAVSYIDSENNQCQISVPQSNYKLIKAHSMVSLDFVLMDPGQTKSGVITGKIAISQTWWYKIKHRNDFGYVNEKEFQKFAAKFELISSEAIILKSKS